MKNRALFWVLLPPAIVAVLFLAAIFGITLALLPPFVTAVALGVLALVVLWFIFHRRAVAGVASEASLMGRQKSVEGLL